MYCGHPLLNSTELYIYYGASMSHALPICISVTMAAQLGDDLVPIDFHSIDKAQNLSELSQQYAANQKASQDHTTAPGPHSESVGTVVHTFLSL